MSIVRDQDFSASYIRAKHVADVSTAARCAIYTRKSTEEGLEQDFNSLDAQREACAAYIVSQRHEGWSALPDTYEDGGYSGGSMDRPGLKALLADIAAGKVDIIVVYKVDRLTRSLADFAKVVEILDAKNASFISVTQALNTTSSMGRLTLNILLSFAQFEREMTGERIRDKVAASKARGMWMGGPVPLGYDLEERKLIINPAEAAIVRHIFARYLAISSGREVVAELDADGHRSKSRTDRNGRAYGGARISRGALYSILQNRLYAGEVVHGDKRYPGQHEAIIQAAQFEQAQTLLATRRTKRRSANNADAPALLAGLLWDGNRRRMSPTHTLRGGKCYRYYVSQNDGSAERAKPVWRVSAGEMEERVIDLVEALFAKRCDELIRGKRLSPEILMRLKENAKAAEGRFADARQRGELGLIHSLLRRVELTSDELRITAILSPVDPAFGTRVVTAATPVECTTAGRQTKIVIASNNADSRRPDPALAKLVVQAISTRTAMQSGACDTFKELALRLGYSREHAADLIRVSYLAPDIVTAILEGQQPSGLTRTKLIRARPLPPAWSDQRRLFGFAHPSGT